MTIRIRYSFRFGQDNETSLQRTHVRVIGLVKAVPIKMSLSGSHEGESDNFRNTLCVNQGVKIKQ